MGTGSGLAPIHTPRAWNRATALRPRQLARGPSAVFVVVACIAALGAVLAGDLATEGTSTVGALGILPVIAGAWLLSRPYTAVLVIGALLCRALAWRFGDVSALTALSQGLVAAVVALAVALASTSIRRAVIAEAAAEQAANARLILDSALDAVVTMDGHGVTHGWGRGAEVLFGWTAAEAVGRRVVDLIVPPAFREAHNLGLARYRETGEAPVLGNVLSLSAVDRSGRVFPIEIAISAASSDDQAMFIAFVRDVSERRRAEEAVASALAAAEAASQAKTEYLSRMSHELRTPLTAIIGFAGLLEMEDPRPDQLTGLETIIKAGDHLLAMIDDLLEISTIESGHEALSLEPVRLDEVVAECAGLVALAARARGITVMREPNGPSGHVVDADRQRLQQVVLNLLSNAIKYNRNNGTVRISARSAAAGRVRLSVTDTGPGVDPDKVGRLFLPFERLGAERTEVEGTGLGLALCKRLVQAMSGTIGVETAAGEGATFWVELPEVHDDEELPGPDGGGLGEVAAVPSEATQLILYVEDNLANVELVGRILQHRPAVKLLPVMQGSLALELAGEHRPDVVLLDIHLPDIDGDEVLRRLKQDPRTLDIPVIILSADASERRVARLREAGAAAYLTKPIRVRELLAAIDQFTSAEARGS